MRDLGIELQTIIDKQHCTPTYAFLLLLGEDYVHSIQSKSKEKTCRRLRDTGNIQSNRQTMG